MPVTVPALDSPPRFDPVFVTDDDLEDLATYTGMTREACLERLRDYSPAEMAEEWRRADPKTPQEILAFYRTADLYVWDLMQWHASQARRLYWETLARFAQQCPAANGYRRVYDFGCGIGTDALFLSCNGYEVTLADVNGPAFRFARHRFARRGLKARFIESSAPLPQPDGVYDAAVCFDVFEHLVDPVEAVRRLVAALRPGGILLQQGAFGDDGNHPCHLKEGVRRFPGLCWHIQLAGLGLRSETSMLYRKVRGTERLAQHIRYAFWRISGLWLIRTGGGP